MSAIGLWIHRVRKWSCFILWTMHLFILCALVHHHWNQTVWPWNVAFGWLLYEFFYRPQTVWLNVKTLKNIRLVAVCVLMLLTLCLPVLNFFGRWDHFLSGGFYSAMADEAVFYYSAVDKNMLPGSSGMFQYRSENKNEEFLMLDHWALNELNVPLYPERRTHEAIARKICEKINHPDKAGLTIVLKKRFDREVKTKNCPCSNLSSGTRNEYE
jgi:hypothetical protein